MYRPVNKEELFNLRHAKARNVVEHIFGVLKKRWGVLTNPLRYNMDVQARVVLALIAIHNLILQYDPQEQQDTADVGDDDAVDLNPGYRTQDEGQLAETLVVPEAERTRAEAKRDRIAQEMWDSYQAYIQEYGHSTNDDLE
ncbi:hypothetical protein MPER_13833 [Moniliophthora perniciosa FA553]|nr:hypothetical protein MPER_13833 [Moniliophthora perniciosa FA553]